MGLDLTNKLYTLQKLDTPKETNPILTRLKFLLIFNLRNQTCSDTTCHAPDRETGVYAWD